MKFRPCIDLLDGNVVQIVGGQGVQNPVTNFSSSKSSADYARLYKSAALSGGHIISLKGNNEDAILTALQTYPDGFQVGGGIDPLNASRYLEAGASHVIVTSYIFRNGVIEFERLRKLSKTTSKKRLVLDLSCRRREGDYFIVTDRWKQFTHSRLSIELFSQLAQYCDEFLIHGVDVEGKMAGIEDDLVALLADASPLPCTYAGGIRSLEDLERINVLGQGKVDATIGSALDIFGGELPFDEVVKWHPGQQNNKRKGE